MVDGLAETDDKRWETRTWRRRGFLKLSAVLVGLVGAVCSALARPGDISFIVFGPLLFVVVAAIVRGALSDVRGGRRALRPSQWRGAALKPGRTVLRHRGVPTASDDDALLVAPLSGRVCVAYELAVRRDTDVDAAPWSWALIEQAVAAVRVGDHHIDPVATQLVVRRTPCPDGLDNRGVGAALRMRGVDLSRGSYAVFESVIEPGAPVDVEVDAQGRARMSAPVAG